MIEQVSVAELYGREGFEDMIAEYATHKIKRMPKPLYRYADYLPMEQAGMLSVWAAMDAGSLVGFMSMLTPKIPHYGCVVAIVESLFVRECSRKRGLGLRLLSEAEHRAEALNVPGMFVSAPVDSDLERILVRRTFRGKPYSAETTSFFVPMPCSQPS